MLQSLPPDALASILSCDTLAVTSENTVLAAVDVWLAGPTAQALAHQTDSVLSDSTADPVAAAAATCDTPLSVTGCCSSMHCCQRATGSNSHSTEVSSGAQLCASACCPTQHSALLSALRLLIGSVRLNQCSGPFLAAAVQRMPWLCRALQHKAEDWRLLKQYHRWVLSAQAFSVLSRGCTRPTHLLESSPTVLHAHAGCIPCCYLQQRQ